MTNVINFISLTLEMGPLPSFTNPNPKSMLLSLRMLFSLPEKIPLLGLQSETALTHEQSSYMEQIMTLTLSLFIELNIHSLSCQLQN